MSGKRQTRPGDAAGISAQQASRFLCHASFNHKRYVSNATVTRPRQWNVQTMDVPGYLSSRPDLTSSNIEQRGQDVHYSAN